MGIGKNDEKVKVKHHEKITQNQLSIHVVTRLQRENILKLRTLFGKNASMWTFDEPQTKGYYK